MKSLDIPIHKWAELVTNGAPSTSRKNSDMSSLVTNDMKNTTEGYLIICHYMIHEYTNIWMINPVTLLSKLLILLGKKKLMFVNLQRKVVELYEIWIEVFSIILKFNGWALSRCLTASETDFRERLFARHINEVNVNPHGPNQLEDGIADRMAKFERQSFRLWKLQLRLNNHIFPEPERGKLTNSRK
jgi:hypothetical protein